MTLATLLTIDVNQLPAEFTPRGVAVPEGAPEILSATRAPASPEAPTTGPAEPIGTSETEAEMGLSLDNDLVPGGAVDDNDLDSNPLEDLDIPATDATPDEPKPHARVLVIGDATLMSDEFMVPGVSGNRDLVLNAVNYLAAESDLISIRPAANINTGFTLDPPQARALLVMLIALPLGVALTGVVIAVRRRRFA